MSRKSELATPWRRGVTRVDDLHPMHDSAIRRAGAAIVPGDWATHDPFLSMMNDRFAQGAFGPHPHRGIETVTYVLNGSLTHHDNRGGRSVLDPGDVQWMTAGRGVVHLEDALDGESVHVLQLWINLPAAEKLTQPRYQDLRGDLMPVWRIPGVEVRVFSGRSAEIQGPALNYVPITMVELRLEPDSTITQDLPGSYNGFVYVIEGGSRFGRDRVEGHRDQTLWLERADGKNETTVVITASSRLRALLLAGAPLNEPVVARGPFVMNTEEQIEQAYADFSSGRFES